MKLMVMCTLVYWDVHVGIDVDADEYVDVYVDVYEAVHGDADVNV